MKALIALVALLALVYAQNTASPWAPYTAWSATFVCTAPQFGSGVFTGKVIFDWSVQAMQIVFDGPQQYQEFYQFNPARGYDTAAPTGQFSFQYLYKSSKSCPCETTGLNFAMPPLFQTATDATMKAISGLAYWTNPSTDSLPGVSGTFSKYLANAQFTNVINSVPQSYILSSYLWCDKSGIPAGFNINDFQRRTFALQNIASATPGSLSLVAPKAGCKCGKQLDIAISLDRSGSISRSQWDLEYQFTQNLVASFSYGPLLTNLAIGNWNAAQWTTLSILSGIDAATVNSAVSSMTCCPGATSTSCCCCGTPIGGGLWLGGNLLSSSTRGKAQKVLLLLTDGCQNHLWYPDTGTAVNCGCASEKACASNATCVADITKWYNWVTTNIPGVRIIVIGVGDATTICKDQLLLAAGGDSLNVYNPQDWNQLLSLVDSISATACTADNALCPGCCGICTCGQCIPPTKCLDQDKCTLGVLDNSTQCCTTSKVECPQQLCKFQYCDPSKGCQYANITCQPDTDCLHYACNNSYVCDVAKKVDPITGLPPAKCGSVVVHQCENASMCNDNNNCTTDVCDPVTFKCKWTTVSCPVSDSCTLYTCKPKEGCTRKDKVCNDFNNCTIDTCDPKTPNGCVYTNVTCPKPKDSCFYSICDPIEGCAILPRDCTKEGYKAQNCTVPACNGTRQCYNQFVCAAPPPTSTESVPDTVILVTTLTTAAVAGIIIAAVLVAAGVGGGAAVAIAQVAAGGGAVVTASNPLYAGAGMGGDNPLNQG